MTEEASWYAMGAESLRCIVQATNEWLNNHLIEKDGKSLWIVYISFAKLMMMMMKVSWLIS